MTTFQLTMICLVRVFHHTHALLFGIYSSLLVGSMIASNIFQSTGSCNRAFWIAGVIAAVGIVLILLTKPYTKANCKIKVHKDFLYPFCTIGIVHAAQNGYLCILEGYINCASFYGLKQNTVILIA